MFKQTPEKHCRIVFGQYFQFLPYPSALWVLPRERFNNPKGFEVFNHCVRTGLGYELTTTKPFFSILVLQFAVSAFG